eukprot:GHVN01083763.1.p1 GENE.GHVN01083763.1~~GHVN01083763.1.p1  ORF type:complete len:581 (-),score=151.04 GHVN01083763.1:111-1610(-)
MRQLFRSMLTMLASDDDEESEESESSDSDHKDRQSEHRRRSHERLDRPRHSTGGCLSPYAPSPHTRSPHADSSHGHSPRANAHAVHQHSARTQSTQILHSSQSPHASTSSHSPVAPFSPHLIRSLQSSHSHSAPYAHFQSKSIETDVERLRGEGASERSLHCHRSGKRGVAKPGENRRLRSGGGEDKRRNDNWNDTSEMKSYEGETRGYKRFGMSAPSMPAPAYGDEREAMEVSQMERELCSKRRGMRSEHLDVNPHHEMRVECDDSVGYLGDESVVGECSSIRGGDDGGSQTSQKSLDQISDFNTAPQAAPPTSPGPPRDGNLRPHMGASPSTQREYLECINHKGFPSPVNAQQLNQVQPTGEGVDAAEGDGEAGGEGDVGEESPGVAIMLGDGSIAPASSKNIIKASREIPPCLYTPTQLGDLSLEVIESPDEAGEADRHGIVEALAISGPPEGDDGEEGDDGIEGESQDGFALEIDEHGSDLTDSHIYCESEERED